MDESNCLLCIERDIELKNTKFFSNWVKGIFNLKVGTCLFFRDIRIVRFDPWEEAIIGVWTEFSSQQTDESREKTLKSWYSRTGQADCCIASQRLSNGIIDVVPDKTSVVIGRINSFQLLSLDSCPTKSNDSKSLHEFRWGIEIDTCITIFRAVVPIHQHSVFSRMCQKELFTAMNKKLEHSELLILQEYFCQRFSQAIELFRFIIDSESEYMLYVKNVEVLTLSQAYT